MDDYKSEFPLDNYASTKSLQLFSIRLIYYKILIKYFYLIEYIEEITL